jgi:hypothetical protein
MTTPTLTRPARAPPDTEEAWLRCRACGHRLATAARDGGAFVNPAGTVHDLLLAARAPGAEALGPITTTATWFDGYGWQLACCGGCGEHVGWCYLATGDAQPDLFFGLRRDALEQP